MSKLHRVMSAAESALSLVQREYPDYHPLVALARMANSADVCKDSRLELEVHKAILPYIMPKLANAEVKVETNQDDRRIIVSLFEQRALPDGTMVDVEVPLVTDVTDMVPLD